MVPDLLHKRTLEGFKLPGYTVNNTVAHLEHGSTNFV